MGRGRIAALVLVALAAAGGALAWSSASRGTRVSPHTLCEIDARRNVVWCATAQLAWDDAGKAAGVEPLVVTDAKDPDGVAAMARHPFPRSSLDPKSFVAIGGTVQSGVTERFERALRDTFGKVPEGAHIPQLAENEAAALAYLRKSMAFAQPFAQVRPMTFCTGTAPFLGRKTVRAFGFESDPRDGLEEPEDGREDDVPDGMRRESREARRALSQVRLHWQAPPSEPTGFVLELLVPTEDRLLLARVEPSDTLEATWRSVAARLRPQGDRLPRFESLAIPVIDAKVAASFDGLCGRIANPGRWTLLAFDQWIEFGLDETGARVESFAAVRLLQGSGDPPPLPRYVFDRPFLLALIERGAERPYFLAWIANADLLVAAD